MTELISEGIVELSTRGSLLQVPILLHSFPSHSRVRYLETYLTSLFFGSVELCGFGLHIAGFLELLSGASSDILLYICCLLYTTTSI